MLSDQMKDFDSYRFQAINEEILQYHFLHIRTYVCGACYMFIYVCLYLQRH